MLTKKRKATKSSDEIIVEKIKAGIAHAFAGAIENATSVTYRENDKIITVKKVDGKEIIKEREARPLVKVKKRIWIFKL